MRAIDTSTLRQGGSNTENLWIIPLTRGYSALVDEEDFERLMVFSWSAEIIRYNLGLYVRAKRMENYRTIRIQYDVLQISPIAGMEIDHINRNPLDNRKENLRLVTKADNLRNTARVINARGITFDRSVNRWRAYWKGTKLGTAKTEEEALELVRRHLNASD